MEKRTHYYVSRKSVLTWLMALCLVGSAVARIVIAGLKGSGDSLDVWSQIVLPIAATLLYVLICTVWGEEMFYKTAIPVWMVSVYCGIWLSGNLPSRLMVWLFWIALAFFAVLYTQFTDGRRPRHPFLLLPLMLMPLAFILYFHWDYLVSGDWDALLPVIPDVVMLLGGTLMVFGIKVHPVGEYHPGKGKSMPSRHTASAAAIAFAIIYVLPGIHSACAMIVLAALIAGLRVLSGQHYPSDVLAALLLSGVISAVGYLI